jgi:hypothetical protein
MTVVGWGYALLVLVRIVKHLLKAVLRLLDRVQ